MIRSEIAQDAPSATVTFTLAHSGLDGHRVAVVGDFNDWDPGATPMDRDNGAYTATLTLHPGRYRFRYLSENGAWFNDDAADDYEPNEHGGQDSVLDLTPTTRSADLTYPRDTISPDTVVSDAPDLPVAGDLSVESDRGELNRALEQDEKTDREPRPRGSRARRSRVPVDLGP